MELNQICLSLLELLFQNNGNCTFSHAQDILHTSKRSLQYQIDKLNIFLQEQGLPEIICNANNMQISLTTQADIDEVLLSEELFDWYFLSSAERTALIILLIAIHHTPATTDALCEQLMVSKNTIVSDLTQLKKRLPSIGLTLLPNHKNGYELIGDEITIRLYMLENIHTFYSNAYSKHYITKFLEHQFHQCFAPLQASQISNLLTKLFQPNHSSGTHRYTSEARDDILLHIYIMLFRHNALQMPVYMEEIVKTNEYLLADQILKSIYTEPLSKQHYKADLYYLTTILLSSKINGTASGIVIETDLLSFADNFLKNFEKLTFIHLENRGELKEKLMLHIRPMYYRLKYDIKLHNVLNEDIKKEYALYFNLTKKAVKLSKNKLDPDIPEDEIAYLCVYLAGWINQSVAQIEQEPAADKLLLVIPGGNSISSLIQLQLINLLKPLRFQYEIISSQDFTEEMADAYPLVLYNGSYSGGRKNIITISAHMNESQRSRILQWSVRYSNLDHNNEVTRLYDLIRNHCTVHDEDLLKAKLFSFLNESQNSKTQIPSLLQILHPSSISLYTNDMEIDRLLLLATKEFITQNIVKALYVPNIMHLLSTLGAYGEITRGVLLLHAEDVKYCNQLGIHICNLEKPLTLHNNPDDIHTIILLSTPDKTSHLRILKDLSSLFRNHSFVEKLECFAFSKSADMYKEICSILTKDE